MLFNRTTMKRSTTVLILCGLLFAADLVWLRLTLDDRASLAGVKRSIEFAGQALAAVTITAALYFVYRMRFARRKTRATRLRSFELPRPLRRLFAAVLS